MILFYTSRGDSFAAQCRRWVGGPGGGSAWNCHCSHSPEVGATGWAPEGLLCRGTLHRVW